MCETTCQVNQRHKLPSTDTDTTNNFENHSAV